MTLPVQHTISLTNLLSPSIDVFSQAAIDTETHMTAFVELALFTADLFLGEMMAWFDDVTTKTGESLVTIMIGRVFGCEEEVFLVGDRLK